MIRIQALRRGEVRRLPYWMQVVAILLFLGALELASIGQLVWRLPADHVNHMLILARRRATLEERIRARVGSDYQAIQTIRAETPPDAVILISDRQDIPSCLHPFGVKNQDWATYFLYPRKLLYLHQRANPLYAKAKWLLVDTPNSVSWMAPQIRGSLDYIPEHYAIVRFDMARYLEAISSGAIPPQYLPPTTQLPAPGSDGAAP